MTIRYAIACAMLCAPTAVLAQTAAPTPVTVEIVASGEVTVPAQRFRMSATITGKGATEDAAKAALAANRAKLLQTLAAMNVREAKADLPANSGSQSMMGLFASMGGLKGPKISFDSVGEDADGKPQSSASETVSLDAPTRAAAADARKAIETAGGTAPEEAVGLLDDYPAASRRAKADALAKARIDAASYGEALGLRQAAIVRISEKQDMIAGSLGFITQIIGMFAPKGGANSNDVTVRETLTVEFKLSK